jgi:hypothetical protein
MRTPQFVLFLNCSARSEVPMPFPSTEIRIGQPQRYDAMAVYPIFREESHPVDYLLSDEALQSGVATISEVSDQGSVPELRVENKSDRRLLLLEAEELRGARQNRILNTSVLVPANSTLTIPVSCVEQRRWRKTSALFAASHQLFPGSVRYALKKSITQALYMDAGHSSDQGKIWDTVHHQQAALSVSSDTLAQADTYQAYEKQLTDAREALPYVAGATGLAVAIGSSVVSADLFDKPGTCQLIWSRLLSGLFLDALASGPSSEAAPEAGQVKQWLDLVGSAEWKQTPAVGEGQEFRAEFNGQSGSMLEFDGNLVHGSIVAQ